MLLQKMKVLVFLFLCVITVKQSHTSLERRIGGRIIGGEAARSGQFPFAAAIDVQTSNTKFFCGGSLISNQWILSGGQCVYAATLLTIYLGTISITHHDSNSLTVATSDVFVHPTFNADLLHNDVGLIKLRLAVSLTEYIQPIKLPAINLPTILTPTVIGWGQTSDFDSELSSELRYVSVGVITNDQCKLTYGNQITESMVCVAGDFNEGACLGDSGSPLVVRPIGGQALEHVGLSSFVSGLGCESADPSGYTRTFPFISWIQNITLTA